MEFLGNCWDFMEFLANFWTIKTRNLGISREFLGLHGISREFLRIPGRILAISGSPGEPLIGFVGISGNARPGNGCC